eukprot:TRINITY_DN10984_c0_g1_i2.p1 TRINITY_DN10984_c0_g1~~TRINITY_DN10984_c0_g1_i2.p1  ORF type:complete len:245 (+),score=93.24 TRINITY_DN10984_c0_g1_i2:109-843(+)
MEKAPRFGKPRQFKRRDTHYNYNRGWDANIGYAGGKYKAKHNKNAQFALDYQPTRREYEDMRNAEASQYDEARKRRYKEGPEWVTKIAHQWKPKQQSQWTPKVKHNEEHNTAPDVHASSSNSNGSYNMIDREIIQQQRYQSGARPYNNQRGNNQYYNQYQQPTHQQWYPQQGYQAWNQPQHPQHPQHPQGYHNNNYYQNPYQQQGHYQQQQQQQYSKPQYRPKDQQQSTQQQSKDSNQSSRKWG